LPLTTDLILEPIQLAIEAESEGKKKQRIASLPISQQTAKNVFPMARIIMVRKKF